MSNSFQYRIKIYDFLNYKTVFHQQKKTRMNVHQIQFKKPQIKATFGLMKYFKMRKDFLWTDSMDIAVIGVKCDATGILWKMSRQGWRDHGLESLIVLWDLQITDY